MGIYLRGKSWYLDFYEGGKRYTERIGPVTRSIAEEKLAIRRAEVIRAEWRQRVVRVPFERFTGQYLEYSVVNKRPGSSLRDQVSIKALCSFFGSRALSEINPLMIERYKQDRMKKVKPATINRELACLRHMFTMAIKWGKIQKNPVKEVKLFREPRGRERILSDDEEARLMETVISTVRLKHLEPIIVMALNTGMRKGEILNLKWVNVDFKAGVITVEGTKTGEIRKIPMNRKLTETLEDVRKVSSGEYVFSDSGKPYGDVKTAWHSALKRAGIEELTFHSLRHTFGTRLGMKGYDIKTIAELLGHKDIKMTMRYSHPTPEHKRRAVESLDPVTTISTTMQVDKDRNEVIDIRNHLKAPIAQLDRASDYESAGRPFKSGWARQ